MKKLMVIGLLAVSASAFAYGGHHYTEIRSEDGTRTICTVRTSHRIGGRHKTMMRNMPSQMRTALEKMRIEIRQRKLNIERLLLDEPVDWKKVEDENRQIGILQGEMKTKIQKYMMTEAPAVDRNTAPRPLHHPEPRHITK